MRSADGWDDGARIRGLVKTNVARALVWTRADALLGAIADPARTALVVGYHRVVDDFSREAGRTIAPMLITRRMLEEQLDWIGRRYRFVGLDELGEGLERRDEPARPLAAVTFDDGYRDVYELAFPLLRRKGIPTAVFVVTDITGSREIQAHDRLYLALSRAFARWADPAGGLRRLLAGVGIEIPGMEQWTGVGWTAGSVLVWLLRGLSRADVRLIIDALEDEVGFDEGAARSLFPMTWDMLARMQRAGVVIGSHTRTHAWLTLEDREEALDELCGSRRELESRLGTTVRHFAYPDGRFDKETAGMVAAAGYRFGYTTCSHRDPNYPLLTIPRRMLWQNSCLDARGRFSPAILSCHVRGVFDLLHGCEQDHAPSAPATGAREHVGATPRPRRPRGRHPMLPTLP
jgi:peptidoglycan/xylan/chitin deacetylase (PgdA/CDA1 family)